MAPRYDNTPRTLGSGYFFGIPLGDLGWFASILMGLASGMVAFFAATFCGIVFILIYNAGGHHALDYADSYKRIGLPIGIFIGVLALTYLGVLWARRKVSRG